MFCGLHLGEDKVFLVRWEDPLPNLGPSLIPRSWAPRDHMRMLNGRGSWGKGSGKSGQHLVGEWWTVGQLCADSMQEA